MRYPLMRGYCVSYRDTPPGFEASVPKKLTGPEAGQSKRVILLVVTGNRAKERRYLADF